MNGNGAIVIITSYDGPYGGNFIASLCAFDKKVKEEGLRTIYIFQEKVKDYKWIPEVVAFANRVAFLPYYPYSVNNVRRIRRIVEEEKACLIYSRMGGWDIAAHLAAPNTPIVWHMEMNPNLRSRIKRIKYFGKYKILGARNVYSVAVSQPGADALNSLNLRHKCIAIPNAADFTRLPSVPKEYVNRKAPKKLLVFGYNPPVKGLDLALDACERINAETLECELMVSAQTRTYEYVRTRYGEVPPSWLSLIPPTDSVSMLYETADVMLSPSRSEGFSFCLLEALYSGLPAVYSDISGTNWADEMRGVYRFSSESVDDFVRAIRECTYTGISRADQQFNRSVIEKKYSQNSWAEAFLELTRKLISAE